MRSVITCLGTKGLAIALVLCSSLDHAAACGLAWSPTPEDALRAAKLTNRLAIVVFTGSDWSLKSAQLDQDILMNVEFTDYAARHFALANADFPQRQRPAVEILEANTELATRHKIHKWPTLLALRPDGTEFARIEYSGETAHELLKRIGEWQQGYQSLPQRPE